MVERIEDLNLPNAVVTRLIKEAIPEGVAMSKEARRAMTRAAAVYVIYMTSTCTKLAHSQNHKTISCANVYEALSQMELESFIEPLNRDLEVYRTLVREKKNRPKNTTIEEEEEEEEDNEPTPDNSTA